MAACLLAARRHAAAHFVLTECGQTILSFLGVRSLTTAASATGTTLKQTHAAGQPPKQALEQSPPDKATTRTYVPTALATRRFRAWNSRSVLDVFENPDSEVAYQTIHLLRQERRFRCKPETLIRALKQEWVGDPAQAPSGVRNFEHFPELFDITYQVSAKYEALFGGKDGAAAAIRAWTAEGKQRMLGEFEQAGAQAGAGQTEESTILDVNGSSVSWRQNIASVGVRSVRFLVGDSIMRFIRTNIPGTAPPTHLVEAFRPVYVALTPAALRYNPRLDYSDTQLYSIWGQVLMSLLTTFGTVSAPVIGLFLQKYAVQHNLPLPPTGLAWFLMSRHPAFSFCRPVWRGQPRGVTDPLPRGPQPSDETKQVAVKMSDVIIGAQVSDERLIDSSKAGTPTSQLLHSLLAMRVDPNAKPSDFLPRSNRHHSSVSLDRVGLDVCAMEADMRMSQRAATVSASTAASSSDTKDVAAPLPASGSASSQGSAAALLWLADTPLPAFRLACPAGVHCTDPHCKHGHPFGRVRSAASAQLEAAIARQGVLVQSGAVPAAQTVDWEALLDGETLGIRDAEGRAVGHYTCTHGMACVNDQCYRTHPPGWSPEFAQTFVIRQKRALKPCTFGIKCAQADCEFKHPEGWDPVQALKEMRAATPCLSGSSCHNAACEYQHPPGWIPTKKACMHGDRCSNPNCSFTHPAGWDPLARQAYRQVKRVRLSERGQVYQQADSKKKSQGRSASRVAEVQQVGPASAHAFTGKVQDKVGAGATRALEVALPVEVEAKLDARNKRREDAKAKAAGRSQGITASLGSLSLEGKEENSKLTVPTAGGRAQATSAVATPRHANGNGKAAITHTMINSRTKGSSDRISKAAEVARKPVRSADKLQAFGDLHGEAVVGPPLPDSGPRPAVQTVRLPDPVGAAAGEEPASTAAPSIA